MPSIKIMNVGPIQDTGELILNQYNVFIGPQSSGKSTIMKIICCCFWIEKQIMLNNSKMGYYRQYSRFIKNLKSFHKLDDTYFNPQSQIIFRGEFICIEYKNGTKKIHNAEINWIDSPALVNTKLSFIPSERNLVFAIQNVDQVYKSQNWDNLLDYVNEWTNIRTNYTENSLVKIPFIEDVSYYYDKKKDKEFIRLGKSKKEISPYYASSGVQSSLPIMVMVRYLTDMVYKESVKVSVEMIKDISIKKYKNHIDNEPIPPEEVFEHAGKEFSYKSSVIFIEEPEQNLFPKAQLEMIIEIARLINERSMKMNQDSRLCVTTHSPYIITALNTLILADKASKVDKVRTRSIIPENASIPFEKVSAYYVHEDGTVNSLMDEELSMIIGNDLDSASDIVVKKQEQLDDIIYGNVD